MELIPPLLLLFVSFTTTASKDFYLDNEHGELGMLVPLEPFASITGHSGLLSSGMTGAALLNFKAAAVLGFYLALRRGNKGRYYRVNSLLPKRRRWSRSVPQPPDDDTLLDSCATRLLCDLATQPDPAAEDEQLILSLFGPDFPAAFRTPCNYSCPYSGREFMGMLRGVVE